MSSHCTIAPFFYDIGMFMEALKDLKIASRKIAELKTSDGKTHKVEAVFEDGVGRLAGLAKTEKGYQLVTDSQDLTAEEAKKQNESIQQVVQRYAYRKVVKQLQAEGYQVAEEQKQADNSIRLVCRKWSS